MALLFSGIRIAFLFVAVCLGICLGQRGYIKNAALFKPIVKSPFFRSLRVHKAVKVLLTGAKHIEHAENHAEWYVKAGGKERADKDFFLINAFGVTEGFSLESGGVWKQGMVGDYVVRFTETFSDQFPYPAIHMYRKSFDSSRENEIVALYKGQNF